MLYAMGPVSLLPPEREEIERSSGGMNPSEDVVAQIQYHQTLTASQAGRY